MKLKKDNKGFSLVELIVVVAIMAVLMGILVPTLVKNVEKSKKQKDLSGIEEVRSTMEKCLADENFSAIDTTIKCTGGKIEVSKFTAGTTLQGDDATNFTNYIAEVKDQITDYTCKSKEFKPATVEFTIKDEKVCYKVTNTKSKKDYTSENYTKVAATGENS